MNNSPQELTQYECYENNLDDESYEGNDYCEYSEINRLTFEWFRRMKASNNQVTDSMIQQAALEFTKIVNTNDTTFTASIDWLLSFKAKYKIILDSDLSNATVVNNNDDDDDLHLPIDSFISPTFFPEISVNNELSSSEQIIAQIMMDERGEDELDLNNDDDGNDLSFEPVGDNNADNVEDSNDLLCEMSNDIHGNAEVEMSCDNDNNGAANDTEMTTYPLLTKLIRTRKKKSKFCLTIEKQFELLKYLGKFCLNKNKQKKKRLKSTSRRINKD